MPPEPIIPRTNDTLANLHYEIACSFQVRFGELRKALAILFGEPATKAAFASLLIPASLPLDRRTQLREELDRQSIDEFLDDRAPGEAIDTVELTSICRQAAEYANQGCAPMERLDVEPSLDDRKRRVCELIEDVARFRPCSDALIGSGYNYIWDALDARKAIDGFGGKVSLKGLRVLAALPMAVMRTAVSEGDLEPDQDGLLESEPALAWVSRRRQFCPSRWRNLKDDQWPFDPVRAGAADADTVLVPQDSEGKPFVPELVVRSSRGGGLSITVGKKGEEKQLGDFYNALRQLSALAEDGGVPRWRRRNEVGNWGIVRARGAWVAISKSEIARQLASVSPSGRAA
jgi:hypothetical protein